MLEKRGGRCRTDGPRRVLSCQMRHTVAAIKAAWCRSLPAARGSSQLAAIAESLVTDAERRNRRSPACCTTSLMLRVCVMLRVLPSQSSVRSLLVLLLYKQRCLSCLARPVWGTIKSCISCLIKPNKPIIMAYHNISCHAMSCHVIIVSDYTKYRIM